MWVAIYGVLICPLCIFVPSVIQFLQRWFIITNYYFKQTFLPIIWIFTEGYKVKSMLPFKIFSTLRLFFSHLAYTEEIAITVMTLYNTCLVLKIQKEICCEKQFSNLPIVKCNLDAISDQISCGNDIWFTSLMSQLHFI